MELGHRARRRRGSRRGRCPLSVHRLVLGQVADAQVGRAVDLAGVGQLQAHHDLQQRGLAHAVGAHERDASPVAEDEGDAPEQGPGPVGLAQPRDREHGGSGYEPVGCGSPRFTCTSVRPSPRFALHYRSSREGPGGPRGAGRRPVHRRRRALRGGGGGGAAPARDPVIIVAGTFAGQPVGQPLLRAAGRPASGRRLPALHLRAAHLGHPGHRQDGPGPEHVRRPGPGPDRRRRGSTSSATRRAAWCPGTTCSFLGGSTEVDAVISLGAPALRDGGGQHRQALRPRQLHRASCPASRCRSARPTSPA